MLPECGHLSNHLLHGAGPGESAQMLRSRSRSPRGGRQHSAGLAGRGGPHGIRHSGAEGRRTHDHQLGPEPENRSREERGRRPAPGLVDDPLDGDRGIDDGHPRPLSPTHRVRGRIRTVLSVAWRFRVRRVAARLAAARRTKACCFLRRSTPPCTTDRPGACPYQSWARKALHLSDLGLSPKSIARRLRIDDQRAAKAVRFARDAAPSV